MVNTQPQPILEQAGTGHQPPAGNSLPVPPLEPRIIRWIRWLGPIGPLVTMFVLTVSAVAAWTLYFEAKSQNAAQRQHAEVQLNQLRDTIKQHNLATIYTLGNELTKFDLENPKLGKFFDKEIRHPWLTKEEFWREYERLPPAQKTKALDNEYEKLWNDFEALNEEEKSKVYWGCVQIADFTQIAYMHEPLFPDRDWNTWWGYFTDQYDESPFYRVFLSKRPGWYAFTDDLLPGNRDALFRGNRKK
jgi:hypothetical protein